MTELGASEQDIAKAYQNPEYEVKLQSGEVGTIRGQPFTAGYVFKERETGTEKIVRPEQIVQVAPRYTYSYDFGGTKITTSAPIQNVTKPEQIVGGSITYQKPLEAEQPKKQEQLFTPAPQEDLQRARQSQQLFTPAPREDLQRAFTPALQQTTTATREEQIFFSKLPEEQVVAAKPEGILQATKDISPRIEPVTFEELQLYAIDEPVKAIIGGGALVALGFATRQVQYGAGAVELGKGLLFNTKETVLNLPAGIVEGYKQDIRTPFGIGGIAFDVYTGGRAAESLKIKVSQPVKVPQPLQEKLLSEIPRVPQLVESKFVSKELPPEIRAEQYVEVSKTYTQEGIKQFDFLQTREAELIRKVSPELKSGREIPFQEQLEQAAREGKATAFINARGDIEFTPIVRAASEGDIAARLRDQSRLTQELEIKQFDFLSARESEILRQINPGLRSEKISPPQITHTEIPKIERTFVPSYDVPLPKFLTGKTETRRFVPSYDVELTSQIFEQPKEPLIVAPARIPLSQRTMTLKDIVVETPKIEGTLVKSGQGLSLILKEPLIKPQELKKILPSASQLVSFDYAKSAYPSIRAIQLETQRPAAFPLFFPSVREIQNTQLRQLPRTDFILKQKQQLTQVPRLETVTVSFVNQIPQLESRVIPAQVPAAMPKTELEAIPKLNVSTKSILIPRIKQISEQRIREPVRSRLTTVAKPPIRYAVSTSIKLRYTKPRIGTATVTKIKPPHAPLRLSPGIISASASKLRYGKATPPKITKKLLGSDIIIGIPSLEQQKRGVDIRRVLGLR